MSTEFTLPKHTPYDGSSSPFGIGLRPLDLANWIEVDDHLPRYLFEKQRLMREIPEKVWAEHGDTGEAQQEVLDLLVPHLLEKFPQVYQRKGDRIGVKGAIPVDLDGSGIPPLLKAAYLVQEDLVLMRKREKTGNDGWFIAAASVCFPSSWILDEKIGRVMHDVHAPVPGFARGTRNAMMIERIFDKLLIDQSVERFNWSIYNDPSLYHADRAGEHFPDHEKGEQDYFLRIEHQTLRKLPKSGDILFGIRIHVDPMEVLAKRGDREELAESFVATIQSMKADEARYKGLEDNRSRLIERIREVTQCS